MYSVVVMLRVAETCVVREAQHVAVVVVLVALQQWC